MSKLYLIPYWFVSEQTKHATRRKTTPSCCAMSTVIVAVFISFLKLAYAELKRVFKQIRIRSCETQRLCFRAQSYRHFTPSTTCLNCRNEMIVQSPSGSVNRSRTCFSSSLAGGIAFAFSDPQRCMFITTSCNSGFMSRSMSWATEVPLRGIGTL